MSSETIPPVVPGPMTPPAASPRLLHEIPPEVIPDLDQFVIEDGEPVDSVFAEKQQRLLGRTLYVSWPRMGQKRPFQVFANVGLFYAVVEPGLCPDVMLGLDIPTGGDLSKKENRSYFTWLRGKAPDVVIEIVSDTRGGETGYKMSKYEQLRVPYYVVFDPANHLEEGPLRCWRLADAKYEPMAAPFLFPGADVGVALWEGAVEGEHATWLRWCDLEGQLIPLDEEVVAQAEERAVNAEDRLAKAEDRADKLAARLRELGIEP